MVQFSDLDDGTSDGANRALNSKPDGGAIHLEILLDRCMDDASFALALLAELETAAPALVDQLAEEISRGELNAVAESMHTLKGATGIVAAERLSELARQGEAAGREGDLDQVQALMSTIHSELAFCLESLPGLRQRLLT